MKKPHIGFIGTGIMGAPMAGHLSKAGYMVTIYDTSRERMERVVAENDSIMIRETPRSVAEVSDIVITMLPSGEVVQKAVFEGEGLFKGFRSGSLLLDTSSSQPWLTLQTADKLAERGVEMVDAPVSGALAGAQAAKLIFMVGGKKESVSRVLPLLHVLGEKIFQLGPVGAGHAMKCLNNLITAMTFMVTAEGLTVGKKFGLDPEIMTDVLNLSTGMSWISQTHIKQRILNRKFDDPFKLELMIKDIGIAMELANTLELPIPLSALGHHLWKAAGQSSKKGDSISNMVRWVESMTGTKIVPGSNQ
jgi:3-hydroxyisobutyrate dehydrogenase-like beta-hydroxyacid dehydrogenase